MSVYVGPPHTHGGTDAPECTTCTAPLSKPHRWAWFRWQEGAPQDIPDLVPVSSRPTCRDRQHGFTCTRPANHTGRHAAGTGDLIVGVWA